MDKDLLHPDYYPKRGYRNRPRQNARMPVILHRDYYDRWLDPGMQNVAAISEVLKPYDADSMRSYPVNPKWV